MDHWHIRTLGYGTQVYQSLRELREIRFQHDSRVPEERLYIVATDTVTLETFAFFPPGNAFMAVACGASPCDPSDFEAGRLFRLSVETFPIISGYPSDDFAKQDPNDF